MRNISRCVRSRRYLWSSSMAKIAELRFSANPGGLLDIKSGFERNSEGEWSDHWRIQAVCHVDPALKEFELTPRFPRSLSGKL
jgi:hypothetical protein